MDFLSQNCGLSQIGSAAAYVMRPPPTSIAVRPHFISLIFEICSPVVCPVSRSKIAEGWSGRFPVSYAR
jgi:hypothetical protein